MGTTCQRGSDDHHHVQVRGWHRGRQDLRQVQGSEHRPGHGRAPDRRWAERGSHRAHRQVGERADGRGCALLGGAPAHQPVGHLGPVDAHLGQLHRFRGWKVDEERAAIHRPRSAADRDGQHARPPVRPAVDGPRIARHRIAGLLPPACGGPGRGVRPRARWHLRADPHLRQRSLRQVCRARHALLQRKRRGRVADGKRSRRAHAVAHRAARRRYRLRDAARLCELVSRRLRTRSSPCSTIASRR